MHLLVSHEHRQNILELLILKFNRVSNFLLTYTYVVLYVTYLLHGAESFLKLTGFKLVKKFPAFYGTRRFITAITSPRHLSLSWASSIQSIVPHLTSWRTILILFSHLRLGLPCTARYHEKKWALTVNKNILTEKIFDNQPGQIVIGISVRELQ
jgi:hypothetical protein